MEYKVKINEFEGPLDLLLHLVKESDINIEDIKIDVITKQYLDYINAMEELNLDIASEYLVMAAELIELKSNNLLPKKIQEEEMDEDPKDELIKRLLEYESYKKMTEVLREYESDRKEIHVKEPSNLEEYRTDEIDININLDDILKAFSLFLEKQEFIKPLNTKITTMEYSTAIRSEEIKKILKSKKRIELIDIFDVFTKDYIVVTFLSVLELVKKKEIGIEQEKNFDKIFLLDR